MKSTRSLRWWLALLPGFPLMGGVGLVESADAVGAVFPLVNTVAAPLVVPAEAPPVVRLAARDLAADIARVTGQRPDVLDTLPAGFSGPHVRVIWSAELAGRWEAFQLSATPNQLTVAGADARAMVYGLYELSRRIGVSPWHWWADEPFPTVALSAEPPWSPRS